MIFWPCFLGRSPYVRVLFASWPLTGREQLVVTIRRHDRVYFKAHGYISLFDLRLSSTFGKYLRASRSPQYVIKIHRSVGFFRRVSSVFFEVFPQPQSFWKVSFLLSLHSRFSVKGRSYCFHGGIERAGAKLSAEINREIKKGCDTRVRSHIAFKGFREI